MNLIDLTHWLFVFLNYTALNHFVAFSTNKWAQLIICFLLAYAMTNLQLFLFRVVVTLRVFRRAGISWFSIKKGLVKQSFFDSLNCAEPAHQFECLSVALEAYSGSIFKPQKVQQLSEPVSESLFTYAVARLVSSGQINALTSKDLINYLPFYWMATQADLSNISEDVLSTGYSLLMAALGPPPFDSFPNSLSDVGKYPWLLHFLTAALAYRLSTIRPLSATATRQDLLLEAKQLYELADSPSLDLRVERLCFAGVWGTLYNKRDITTLKRYLSNE